MRSMAQAGRGRGRGQARQLRGGAGGHSAQPRLAAHLAAVRAAAPGGPHAARHRGASRHALRPGQRSFPA